MALILPMCVAEKAPSVVGIIELGRERFEKLFDVFRRACWVLHLGPSFIPISSTSSEGAASYPSFRLVINSVWYLVSYLSFFDGVLTLIVQVRTDKKVAVEVLHLAGRFSFFHSSSNSERDLFLLILKGLTQNPINQWHWIYLRVKLREYLLLYLPQLGQHLGQDTLIIHQDQFSCAEAVELSFGRIEPFSSLGDVDFRTWDILRAGH